MPEHLEREVLQKERYINPLTFIIELKHRTGCQKVTISVLIGGDIVI